MQASFENARTDQTSFRKYIKAEFSKIRESVAEPTIEDQDFLPAPDLVFNDALFLMETLFASGIPTPDIRWTKDGILNFKWHLEDGVVMLEVYGDGLVVYNVTRDDERPDEISFTLTDTASLQDCLTKLNRLFK
ncbi:immunoglobulin domain-containing protein [Candidatus Poribacteria bacterium]|nr:immunoglobulin domain-containing protein [Candidatus Poribacteria bacterium]